MSVLALFATWNTRAARAAINRCYGIPHLREISSREHHQMLRLERAGIVHRDEGYAGGLHWHLTDKGRRWYMRRAHGWTLGARGDRF